MTNQPEDEKTLDDLGDDRTVHDSGDENPATLNDDQREGETSGPDQTVDEQPGTATRRDEQKTIDQHPEHQHPERDTSDDADWLDKQQSTEISDQKGPADRAPNQLDRTVDSTVPASKPAASATEKQTGVAAPGITAPAGRLRSPKTSLPEHIAGYETLSRLGEGSFGVVLKCRDVKLDRPVAIKLQKVNPVKSQGRMDRFLGEARAAGRLRHPHIVPVYEFGEFGGNQFIVYEFVDGQTMDEWVRSNHDLRGQVEMVARIADALDYAHSLGIVHRDIKPANLLIDHEHQQPHIADFGCAKHENPDGMQTVDGSMMGTPAYMSPEVCDGLANQADGRADLWALGIILYEMLVGQRPFKGKYAELFQQIRSREPKRPRQIDPAIPEDLETITLKCIEKDKDRRFETCGQLADDLRNWLEGRPISARKVGTWERTWLWSKRNPVVATLLGLVASFLILIAAGSILFSIKTQRQKAEIVKGRIDSLGSASATALPDKINDLVSLDPKSIEDVRRSLASQKRGPRESFPFNLALYKLGKASGDVDSHAIKGLAKYVPMGTPERHQTLLKEVVAEDLAPYNSGFWELAQDKSKSSRQRILASSILATTDPSNNRWKDQITSTVEHLLAERSAEISGWAGLLKPVADKFKTELKSLFASEDSSVRMRSAEIASWLFEDDLPFLVELGLTAEPEQLRRFRRVFEKNTADSLTAGIDVGNLDDTKKTNLYLMQALARRPMSSDLALSEFETDLAPIVRHRLINDCGPSGVDVNSFAQWIMSDSNSELDKEKSPALAAAILALGQYDQQQLFLTKREAIKDRLLQLFCEHKDVAVHSACRWLLQEWQFQSEVDDRIASIQTRQPRPGYSWHEDPIGVCFAVLGPVESFEYGPDQSYQFEVSANMKSETVSIPRRFGIAVHETTCSQFADWETQMMGFSRLQAENEPDKAEMWNQVTSILEKEHSKRSKGVANAPVGDVSWNYIAFCCNRLNQFGGINVEENIYNYSYEKGFLKSEEIEDAPSKLGYRLPTAEEWEFACRGESMGRFFFGDADDLFQAYGWSSNNSDNVLHDVGSLKPNDSGLFDVHGNTAEWCHNMLEPETLDSRRLPREIRSQSYLLPTERMTVFDRASLTPNLKYPYLGFRLGRTYSNANDSQ